MNAKSSPLAEFSVDLNGIRDTFALVLKLNVKVAIAPAQNNFSPNKI